MALRRSYPSITPIIWARGFYRLFNGVIFKALRVTRESLEDYLEAPEQDKEVTKIVIDNLATEVHREMRISEASTIASILQWLSERNISPETLKALTFGGFLVLTIADIFTS